MNIPKVLLIMIVIVYGVASILAVFIQMKKNKLNRVPNLIMIAGAMMIIISVIFKVHLLFVLILGLFLIHVSAIWNGWQMFGKVHYKHHIIRTIISLTIIISYIILK